MLLEHPKTIQTLQRIVCRITLDGAWQDDLLQEARIFLWQAEDRRPGQRPSWYFQGCLFHLRNWLRRGRSVDAWKHSALRARASESAAAERDDARAAVEPEPADEMMSEVCARDALGTLMERLGPCEREILGWLWAGFGVREIARRLRVSHVCVQKRRARIARVASKLGLSPPSGNRRAEH
ncbi:MAG TPA: hypothetical protein VNO52_18600 [Methylomirabilota bacterium]|nr:hypothetical protein [Methylomirabilota bacterium]